MSSHSIRCHAKPTPLAAAVAVLISLPSWAQSSLSQAEPQAQVSAAVERTGEQAAARGAETRTQLDAVVVTATRRREPMREVPMQVSVMNADDLQASGAKTLADYIAKMPGVDLNSNGAPGYGGISMRGVTTGKQTVATVGVYVDDVAVGSSSGWVKGSVTGLDMALLDLHHVEALRGPQGTLYGAGAMGGLLKYVTNEPDTYEFSGKVAITGAKLSHGRASTTVNGVLNVPLKQDVAGLRVSAFDDRVGGFVDAVGQAAGKDIDRGTSRGLRASLLVTPAPKLKVRLTATHQNIERQGWSTVNYLPATGSPEHGDLKRSLFASEPYNSEVDLFAADVEYDFGWARFNSITSKQHQRVNVASDDSADLVPLLNDVFGIPAIAAVGTTRIDQRRTTQEFRMTSRADKQFEWLAGYYYTSEKGNQPQLADAIMAGGVKGENLVKADLPSKFVEHALYGDVTWKFGSGVSLTGGLRAARNEQSIHQETSGLLIGPTNSIDGASADSSKTYLLTLGYALSPQSSVYARTATGYRSGGPNSVLRDATGKPLAPAFYDPDTLTSYELGYKADLLDKKLSLELAAYHIDWKDVQQFGLVNGIGVFLNGGEARVRGAELSLNFRPTAQWTLGLSASAIDAKLATDWVGLKGKQGDRMPNSAKFAASLSAQYQFSLAGRPAYAGVAQQYVGNRSAGFVGSSSTPYYLLPAYSLTDLQAGIELGRVSVSIFARNLFDERVQLGTQNGGKNVSVGQPRTIGLTASAQF